MKLYIHDEMLERVEVDISSLRRSGNGETPFYLAVQAAAERLYIIINSNPDMLDVDKTV